MTESDRNLSLNDYLDRAQKVIQDFDVADGLDIQAGTHTQHGHLLEISGSHKGDDFFRTFSYRASETDLREHGDTWFTRRALRSLNDMFLSGHLPVVLDGSQPESQILKPHEEYEL